MPGTNVYQARGTEAKPKPGQGVTEAETLIRPERSGKNPKREVRGKMRRNINPGQRDRDKTESNREETLIRPEGQRQN